MLTKLIWWLINCLSLLNNENNYFWVPIEHINYFNPVQPQPNNKKENKTTLERGNKNKQKQKKTTKTTNQKEQYQLQDQITSGNDHPQIETLDSLTKETALKPIKYTSSKNATLPLSTTYNAIHTPYFIKIRTTVTTSATPSSHQTLSNLQDVATLKSHNNHLQTRIPAIKYCQQTYHSKLSSWNKIHNFTTVITTWCHIST